MSCVDPETVQQFIVNHALKGVEKLAKDGDFDECLLAKAEVVSDSDFEDIKLCPTFKPKKGIVN